MKFKHIIWDWNGTLFDDAHICRQITSAHMARLSIPQISEELHQRNFTHPVREYYERIGFDWSSCTFEEIAQSFIIEYEARMHEAHMRQEMLELIPELSAKGVTHAVLSAVRHDLLEVLVERSGLKSYFRKWVGLCDEYAHSKIENGIALLAELQANPDETVLIGDTTHDLETARAMGVQVILLPSGYQHFELLSDCGAPFVNNHAELAEMLKFLSGIVS